MPNIGGLEIDYALSVVSDFNVNDDGTKLC
jgi:hypothetical protein